MALDVCAFDPPIGDAEALREARKLTDWVSRLVGLLAVDEGGG